MQQAIYQNIAINQTADTTATTKRSRLSRQFAHQWDFYGVLALMASSAAYGIYALSHLA